MKNKLTATITLGSLLLGSFAFGQAIDIETLANISDPGDGTLELTGDVSLPANGEYWIGKPLFVTNGYNLEIGEGVVMRFTPPGGGFPSAYLCVSTDGTIDAVGNAGNPIILTTAAAPDKSRQTSLTGPWFDATPKTDPADIDAADDINLWGGFIILGEAPINTGAIDDPDGPTPALLGRAVIEGVGTENGERVYYGGINPNDNSGKVRYVSMRYTGSVLGEGDEIQGLTLGGVGRGTELEFLEVFGSGDDGIEVFGGTASFKYMVLSYFDDDGFDLDQGYTGFAQFGLVVASPVAAVNADNLFEMDGDDDISDDDFNVSDDGRPFTYAQIANFTLIGNQEQSGRGMRLRQGFGGDIYNTIVANVPGEGIRVDATGTANAATFGYPSMLSEDRVAAGTLNLVSTSWYGIGTLGNDSLDADMINNVTASAPGCVNNVSGALATPQFGGNNPAFGDVLQTGNILNPVPFNTVVNSNVANPGNNFFDQVNFRGAFQRVPNADLWTNGWTALNKNGELVNSGINN